MFRLRLLDFWRDPLNWNFLLGFFWRGGGQGTDRVQMMNAQAQTLIPKRQILRHRNLRQLA